MPDFTEFYIRHTTFTMLSTHTNTQHMYKEKADVCIINIESSAYLWMHEMLNMTLHVPPSRGMEPMIMVLTTRSVDDCHSFTLIVQYMLDLCNE